MIAVSPRGDSGAITAFVGCLSLASSACRADVFLNEPGDGSVDGAQSDGRPTIVGSDSTSICVTGQCTCTVNNQCIRDCGGQPETTISGTVYDPAGNNPLYKIAVYIPATLPLPVLPGPPTELVNCPQCPQYYAKPVVAGQLTNASGQFRFGHVPVGDNVPLVVQVGKWRRLTRISTKACQDNPIPDKTLHLPSQGGPDDTLPQFAISTGGADSMECLLKRIGVADSEYASGAGGNGHIHIFQGGGSGSTAGPQMLGGSPPSSTALWPAGTALGKYDVVILSCEGDETSGVNPSALADYANVGGRVFASHFHYAWFTAGNSPFYYDNLASWQTGREEIGNINTLIRIGFNGGSLMAMHDWLKNVGALTNDELPIVQAFYNASVSMANKNSTSWIVADPSTTAPDGGSAAGATEYFSFDTPVGLSAEKQCGRIVYSDLHVGAASNDYRAITGNTSAGVVPSGCTAGTLSPQEKALEFMLFDLAACFTPPNARETNDWPTQ